MRIPASHSLRSRSHDAPTPTRFARRMFFFSRPRWEPVRRLEPLPILVFPRLSSETEFQGLMPHAGFVKVYTHSIPPRPFLVHHFLRAAGVNSKISHVRYVSILTWLRGFRVKIIVNCFSFFSLSIPKRDLDTKKTTPNIEVCPESLGAMLEF